MKLLFFMAHPGHLRNFESTLRELDRRGHQVHVVFDRDKGNLALGQLAQTIEATFVRAPAPEPEERWTLIAWQLRAILDYLRYLGPPFEHAPRLRERAAHQVPAALVRSLGARGSRPGLRRLLSALERSVPPRRSVLRLLERERPDLVVVTPLLELGSPQLDYVRAAKSRRIPTCFCVASWDNLTNKGLLHELPDLVTVWNEAQRREAVELHGVPTDRVVSTGAEAYDHWFGWQPTRSREELCVLTGLPVDRPLVLYAGTSPFLAPGESSFVLRWARRVRESSAAVILVRPHPLGAFGTDEVAELERVGDVAVWPPRGEDPVDPDSRAAYFDSLYHADAVVGLNTSAMIEAAIVGRPVLTVLAPEYADGQARTLHFRHLLAENGGPAAAAPSLDEHVAQLARALAGGLQSDSHAFVERFVRPFGLDQPAAPRLVDELELGAERQAEALRPIPAPARAARPVLAAAGAIGLQIRARRSR